MTAKKTKKETTPAKPEAVKFPRKAVPIYQTADDSEKDIARKYSIMTTSPELAAYRVINGAECNTEIGKGIDVPTLMSTLRDQAAAVNRGDMAHAEAMLMNQATALQSLFARLAERGMGCTSLPPQYEADMRIALRAQSQCRATLEALAEMKNPRAVAFVRQANIANGPQQVNNGTAKPSRAEEKTIEQSKLLEAQDANYVDIGTAGASVGADSELATLGQIDRADVGGR
jgi:hypothetical protein